VSRAISLACSFCFFPIFFVISDDPRSERQHFHQPAGPQLVRREPEHARPQRLELRVEQNARVALEDERAAVGTARLLGRLGDDGLVDLCDVLI